MNELNKITISICYYIKTDYQLYKWVWIPFKYNPHIHLKPIPALLLLIETQTNRIEYNINEIKSNIYLRSYKRFSVDIVISGMERVFLWYEYIIYIIYVIIVCVHIIQIHLKCFCVRMIKYRDDTS